MPTSAIPGYGTLLKKGDGGTPETFSTILEVTKLNAPKLSLKEEDATSHGSNGWEEVIGTIIKGDDISVECNWVPTDPTQNATTGVLAALLNRSKGNWKLVLPNASQTTFTFAAIVKSFEGDAPVDGKLKCSFTLKPSGQMTVS